MFELCRPILIYNNIGESRLSKNTDIVKTWDKENHNISHNSELLIIWSQTLNFSWIQDEKSQVFTKVCDHTRSKTPTFLIDSNDPHVIW